jgi:hypothetical protein
MAEVNYIMGLRRTWSPYLFCFAEKNIPALSLNANGSLCHSNDV